MRLNTRLLTAACAVGFLGGAAAVPYPVPNMTPAIDLGLTQNVSPGTRITLTNDSSEAKVLYPAS